MNDPREINWQNTLGKGYWQDLTRGDIIEWCRPLLESGSYHLRDIDGKIEGTPRMSWDTPWHHVKHTPGFDCGLLHQIMFSVIFARLHKMSWVPAFCHNCFKVVARPNNLKQLFALLNLQYRIDRPSKCGIEPRTTVMGNYGGYWYNVGLEAGQECYQAVRKAIDADPDLGKDVGVILKRACTEYELRVGPSDKWELTQEQLQAEAIIRTWVHSDPAMRSQSQHVLNKVHRRWVEHAYAVGDETFVEFTDGQSLYPPLVTYHNTKPKPKKKATGKKK